MTNLYKSKDYHWSLFIGHLVIEKLLKAKIVKKQNRHAPFTHDLRKLSRESELIFDDEKKTWLDTISTFNINARYDNYTQDFYKKCTKKYCQFWIKRIKKLSIWIKNKL